MKSDVAYIGAMCGGIHVVDLVDPCNPVLKVTIPPPSGDWTFDVYAVDHGTSLTWLYSAEYTSGYRIHTIQKSSPTWTVTFKTLQDTPGAANGILVIEQDPRYPIVVADRGGGVRIYDYVGDE